MTKKILGIDLGVGSIGWALVKLDDENPANNQIIRMGVRVVPIDSTEVSEFSKGKGETPNRQRTAKRGMRRMYARYVMRRQNLTRKLSQMDMFDPSLFHLDRFELWKLRARAVNEQVSLKELGRILYHLNQRRGYKSNRKSTSVEERDSDYLNAVKGRYDEIKQLNQTIGEYFYNQLAQNPHYRIREKVFPREAYEEEFYRIMQHQRNYYPEILTDTNISEFYHIIYFQRPLKSQKGLVKKCELVGEYKALPDGKVIFVGPRVAPRSSPLFQIEKIWESINNIKLKDKYDQERELSLEEKQKVFAYLNENKKLKTLEFYKLLGLNKNDYYGNKMLSSGIEGNITLLKIKEVLEGLDYDPEILKFELSIKDNEAKVDESTGEIIGEKEISACVEKENLYRLWHIIYSIENHEECKQALMRNFNLSEEAAERLSSLDFTTAGYGNKSHKLIRKILPYLMEGYKYPDACQRAGYRHSGYRTGEENLRRQLADKINLLPKNSLRQPIVEKILNQLIHLVNDIIDEKNGLVTKEERSKGMFEINIELARELKQSKEDRKETWQRLDQITKENEKFKEELMQLGLPPTRNNILKMRLFYESVDNKDQKINGICLYCGKPFGKVQALRGDEVDVDHIIPRSLIFDDSQSNKILVHRACNAEKGNQTAHDFMKSKGEDTYNAYIDLVKRLHNAQIISNRKRDKLLLKREKIDKKFIERQLKETQYISRKAVEILDPVSYSVSTTPGILTAKLRHLWGWDDVVLSLQKERFFTYYERGLSQASEEEKEQVLAELEKNYSKRVDHRHHAIDALTIACTKKGFIQRLSTLYAENTRQEMYEAIQALENGQKLEGRVGERLSLLENYLGLQRPFTTAEVKDKAGEIIVSFKPGKKVAVRGRNIVLLPNGKTYVQRGVIVPRGPLCGDSVYGKIKIIDGAKDLKYIFSHPDLIVDSSIAQRVTQRIEAFEGDASKAYKSLKNDPIILDNGKELTQAICYRKEYVIRKALNDTNFEKLKDLDKIIDPAIRDKIKRHVDSIGGESKMKEALSQVHYDANKTQPIRSVRTAADIKVVEPLGCDNEEEAKAFVVPGNNHHVAIYWDKEGNLVESICTFWHAVERFKYGIPVIIENTTDVWNNILSMDARPPESFLKKLPPDNCRLYMSLQLNDVFILFLERSEIESALHAQEYAYLSKYLYRLYKISSKDYNLLNLFETKVPTSNKQNDTLTYSAVRIKSLKRLQELKLTKVRINRLGVISLI